MTRPVIKARLQPTESICLKYTLTAEAGDTIDDILKPEYWAIVGRELRPWAEITVRSDDETFYAKLLVRSCGPTWAKVHLLSYADLQPRDVIAEVIAPPAAYSVKWSGPHTKWRVLRVSDNVVVSEKHEDQVAAGKWITEHLKALA